MTRHFPSLLCLFSSLIFFLPTSCVKQGSKIALEVGQFQFTQKDLELRTKVLQFYYPNETNLNPKKDLIATYKTVQVMLNNGLEDFREKVLEEDRRISSSTLDPTGLAKIRRHFDGDEEAYRRLYVVPTLVGRLFSNFAGRSPATQSRSRERVSQFLDIATKQPSRFRALADQQKLPRRPLRVSEERGVHYGEKTPRSNSDDQETASSPDIDPLLTQQWVRQNEAAAQTESQRWVREFAVSLKAGEVSPRLVDHGDVWLAVKLLGVDKKSNELVFEAVEFAKDSVSEWQSTEEAKIKVTQ